MGAPTGFGEAVALGDAEQGVGEFGRVEVDAEGVDEVVDDFFDGAACLGVGGEVVIDLFVDLAAEAGAVGGLGDGSVEGGAQQFAAGVDGAAQGAEGRAGAGFGFAADLQGDDLADGAGEHGEGSGMVGGGEVGGLAGGAGAGG